MSVNNNNNVQISLDYIFLKMTSAILIYNENLFFLSTFFKQFRFQKYVIQVLSIITVLLPHGQYYVVKIENPVPSFSYPYTINRSKLVYIIELMYSTTIYPPEIGSSPSK